jgi:hypothetical protein
LNQTNEFVNFIINGVIIKQGSAWKGAKHELED